MGGVPARVRVAGPLAVFAEGFRGELARLGYKPNAAADQLRLMAHLSRWMDAGNHGVAGLTPPVAEAFLAARRAEGYATPPTWPQNSESTRSPAASSSS